MRYLSIHVRQQSGTSALKCDISEPEMSCAPVLNLQALVVCGLWVAYQYHTDGTNEFGGPKKKQHERRKVVRAASHAVEGSNPDFVAYICSAFCKSASWGAVKNILFVNIYVLYTILSGL